MLLFYVDGMLLIDTNVESIAKLKAKLHSTFIIKDLGEARFFLSLEICCISQGILLN